MKQEQKAQIIEEIAQDLANYSHVYVTDISGFSRVFLTTFSLTSRLKQSLRNWLTVLTVKPEISVTYTWE